MTLAFADAGWDIIHSGGVVAVSEFFDPKRVLVLVISPVSRHPFSVFKSDEEAETWLAQK
jgi:hypothetical protein